MRGIKVDYIAKAREAWGNVLPDEVVALAEEAARIGGARAASRIGYSAAVVSNVLGNRYPGDLDTVFAKIRGAFMGETVNCPVLGDIGRDQCLTEQRKPFAATNATRARIYHACRAGCPHSRLKKD